MVDFFPKFSEFQQRYKEKKRQVVWATYPADLETPVLAMLKLKGEAYSGLFESVMGGKQRGRYSSIILKPDVIWRCADGVAQICYNPEENGLVFEPQEGDVFDSLRKLKQESEFDLPEQLPAMASGLFGYMGYDMVHFMEKIDDKNKDSIKIPDSIFFRPQIVIVFDSIKDEMHIVSSISYNEKLSADNAWQKACNNIDYTINILQNSLHESLYRTSHVEYDFKEKSNFTKKNYLKIVEKAKEYIVNGDIFQVVLSQRFTADFRYSAFSLYRSLRRLNPSPYSFYIKFGNFSLVGSSPEILVKVKDGVVTIRPIAGTRKRGEDKYEDEKLKKDLLSDPKELSEHLMLLDLGRNDVGRVAKTASVVVTDKMNVEYYSHVMHIVSNVEGKLKEGMDALDALIAGFPAGTVSGAPKIRAMQIIEELEPERRSFYAGCVGYFSANGDMDTCIALRTALVKDRKLYIQAGGGVVYDSSAEGEYQECLNKAKALLRAAKEAPFYEESI